MLSTIQECWNYILCLLAHLLKQLMFTPTAEDPSLQLTYFDAEGLAEPVRRLLDYAGLEYRDERLTMDAFEERKEHFPFGQVPLLTVDGDVIAQSNAILRYVAKLGKTYPTRNHLNAAIVDMWCELHVECMTAITLNLYPDKFGLPDMDRAAHRDWCIRTHIPRYLQLLEDDLQGPNSDTWLGGMDGVSVADVCWYSTLETWFAGRFDGIDSSTFGPYPMLRAYIKDMAAQLGEETVEDTQQDTGGDEGAVEDNKED